MPATAYQLGCRYRATPLAEVLRDRFVPYREAMVVRGVLLGVIGSIVFIALWELAAMWTTAVGPTISDVSGRQASVAVYVALVLGITLGIVIGRLAPAAKR